jgi:hypothetical protein
MLQHDSLSCICESPICEATIAVAQHSAAQLEIIFSDGRADYATRLDATGARALLVQLVATLAAIDPAGEIGGDASELLKQVLRSHQEAWRLIRELQALINEADDHRPLAAGPELDRHVTHLRSQNQLLTILVDSLSDQLKVLNQVVPQRCGVDVATLLRDYEQAQREEHAT